MPNQDPETVARYEFEVPMDASSEAVWAALTESTNAWWLADFRILGADSTVTLDPVPGGLLAERGKEGSGLVWYTVQMVVPRRSLHLVGHIAPSWGGPTLTMLQLVIDDRAGSTVLRVSDALIGVCTDKQVGFLESGWKQLFTDGLAKHVASAS